MKYIVVILDGASGLPVDAFKGLTTLEAAHTPNLDALARLGEVGLTKNVPDNLEASSNIACTSILGYDPARYPIGRGAIEGAALGIDLQPGQVAFRVNLCSAPDGIMRSYSSDNIGSEEALPFDLALKEALDDEVFALYPATGFRDILVVSGHPELLEAKFTAGHKFPDEKLKEHLPTGASSELIRDYMSRAHSVLERLAANEERIASGKLPCTDAWVFWPGEKPDSMEAFANVYGKRCGLTSGVDLLNGLAQLTEMKRYDIKGVTDGPDTDYRAQALGAIAALDEQDIVFVHIEAPDAEGHDGNIEGKKRAIEKIDELVIGAILEYANSVDGAFGEDVRESAQGGASDSAPDGTPDGATDGVRILALPDHPTPLCTRQHTHDPVPYVMWGSGIAPNGASRLTEAEAAKSGILIDPGYTLLSRFIG